MFLNKAVSKTMTHNSRTLKTRLSINACNSTTSYFDIIARLVISKNAVDRLDRMTAIFFTFPFYSLYMQ